MSRESEHTCHADNCEEHVPPSMFMCKHHWYMLPKTMRDEVWLAYAVGQEVHLERVTPEYLEVTQQCIDFVAEREKVLASPSPEEEK